MKKITTIISILILLAIGARAENILCIGVNQAANYPALTYARQDACVVADLLEESGHNVTLLTGYQATRDAVLKALAAKPDIIYFSGHGETDRLILTDGEIALREIADTGALVLLDCCYVGRGLKDSGSTRVLAAAEHEAFESDGHGLFTKYLVKWMQDGKALVFDNLIEYVTKNIRVETGGWQKPVLGYI